MTVLLLFFLLVLSIWKAESGTVTVDTSIKYQVIEGFGAAIAYYDDWLTAHPKKAQIYDILFGQLGLDILRYRNYYYYDNVSMANDIEIYHEATKSIGAAPKLHLSSWSPPVECKSGNSLDSGTLKKVNGAYVYEEFAQYWSDSLNRYRSKGLNFTYMSIQNEPDWNTSYDSCSFAPSETTDLAGYDKALSAVYNKLKSFANRPKILGPEPLGIGYNEAAKYLEKMNLSQIDGFAHHLYTGGDPTNPDSFASSLLQVQQQYPHLKKYLTEYYGGDWLETAWIMHETLTKEHAVVYLYWNLIWGDSGGLVTLYNPWSTSQWPNSKGYVVQPSYYSFKQFSRYVKPGYVRVDAVASSSNLRVSAYSASSTQLIVVVINVSPSATEATSFTFEHFTTTKHGVIVQTTSKVNAAIVGNYTVGATINFPPYSVSTLVLSKQSVLDEMIKDGQFIEEIMENSPKIGSLSSAIPSKKTQQPERGQRIPPRDYRKARSQRQKQVKPNKQGSLTVL